MFLIILDTTAINVAFPTLRAELGGSLAQSQAIISVYVLALGIATPAAGFLADRYGIKRTFLTGLSTFVVGSALCAAAPGLWTLVGARVIQGLGGGMCMPLGMALLFRAFPPHEQGFALGIFGVALVVAPALGPVLGGALVDAGAWRGIFLVNLPIGGAGVLLGRRFLQEHRTEQRPEWDRAGLLLSTLGFGSLLFAASNAEVRGWASPVVLGAFLGGVSALVAFAFVELRVARYPLLKLELLRDRTFLIATLVGYVSVLALFGAEFLLPLYLQTLRGVSALQAGLILLPLALTSMVVLPIAGRLYDHVGPRPLITIGYGALAVNTWAFAQLDASTPIQTIMLLLAVRGFALGMTVQTTMVAALARVSHVDLPRGSSLIGSTRQVVQAIGVAVLATIAAAPMSAESRALRLGESEAPALCAAAPGDVAVSASCGESLQGFSNAYHFTFALAVGGAMLGLLLPGWPAVWEGRRRTHAPTPDVT